jgi:hypothetical protein
VWPRKAFNFASAESATPAAFACTFLGMMPVGAAGTATKTISANGST